MSARVAHRLAHQATAAECTRCLDVLELPAGHWHASEPGDFKGAVCDSCARRDGDGYAALLAWRRMASPTWEDSGVSVTSKRARRDSRNAPKRTVTPWNKCAGPGCENSIHEHMPSAWKFKREDARYCSNACRQRAYRARRSTP